MLRKPKWTDLDTIPNNISEPVSLLLGVLALFEFPPFPQGYRQKVHFGRKLFPALER